MTRIATTGTSSCATIAIAHFKNGTGALTSFKNKDENEAYKKDPSSFKEPFEGMTVKEFRDRVLMPTEQKLDATGEYPFERLMEELEKTDMKDKFVITALNDQQFEEDDHYWPKELERWGFVKLHATQNNWGSVNHIYIRDRSKVE